VDRRPGGRSHPQRAGLSGGPLTVVVADASALVEYLLRTARAGPIEDVVIDPNTALHVPELCDIEIAAGFRRAMLGGAMSEDRMVQALAAYLDLPITRHGHLSLLPRILDLRANFSVYDAAYLALAERLEASLLTADDRLVRGAQSHTRIPTLPRPSRR
jgi:predicted nucleic acid-binding protein